MEEIRKDKKVFLKIDSEKEDYLAFSFNKTDKEMAVKIGSKCLCNNCYIDILGRLEFIKINLGAMFSRAKEETNNKKELENMTIKKKSEKK